MQELHRQAQKQYLDCVLLVAFEKEFFNYKFSNLWALSPLSAFSCLLALSFGKKLRRAVKEEQQQSSAVGEYLGSCTARECRTGETMLTPQGAQGMEVTAVEVGMKGQCSGVRCTSSASQHSLQAVLLSWLQGETEAWGHVLAWPRERIEMGDPVKEQRVFEASQDGQPGLNPLGDWFLGFP